MFKQFLGVMLSLLLAVLAAMALPASAQTAKAQAPASNAKAVAVGDVGRSVSQAPDQEAKDQIKELAAELKSMQAAVLEGQRKSIDWWFGALAILTTIVAFVGAFLPYMMGRKDKALLQAELKNARDMVASISGLESKAKQDANSLKETLVGVATSPEERAVVKVQANAVAQNPQASDADKLRARAHLASQIQHPSIEQALVAYEHWYALTLLNPKDANAHGNAGVMAHKLYELAATPSQEHWLSLERWHYTIALSIKEEMPDVAFNFGNLLAREALMFYASRNLAAAQTKWHQAGEKYAQALASRKDMPEAACNWSTALLNEAQALLHNNPHDVEVANERIARAEQVLETQAELSEASRVFVAYSLACVYSFQDRTEKAMPQLELSRSNWKNFPGPEHVMKDTALANLRVTPEFQTWFKHHFSNYESPTT